MAAPPGWYDAGVPGQLRWWDGVRWTEHVAGVPAPGSQPVLGVGPEVTEPSTAPSAAPDSVPGAATGAAMGWYPTAAGPLRWWDGQKWTPVRVKNGKPGTDWATVRPWGGYVIGGVGLMLSAWRLLLVLGLLVSPEPVSFSHYLPHLVGLVGYLGAGLLAIRTAAHSAAVRDTPAPSGEPTVPDALQPPPGTVEGVGAGWYPLTSQARRWWTGARWTHYIATSRGVRPDFHGPRDYRTYLTAAWLFIGTGLTAVIVGIVLLLISAEPVNNTIVAIEVLCLISGGVFLFTGVLFLATSRVPRRSFLLPTDPPKPAAALPPR